MKKFLFSATATGVFAVLICPAISAQTPTPPPEIKAATVTTAPPEITRERREQALAKILEGQRYIWRMSRREAAKTGENLPRLAKQAFQKAVELDPNLAEGYTALAELSLSSADGNIDEALMLANIAAKINPNSFGARRIMARLYTIKSRLNNGTLDEAVAQRAVSEWREITRLDPRNAEAWAFLSEFYSKLGKDEERITALNRWMASSAPLENRFYRTLMGSGEDLTTEDAAVKLGAALIKVNRLPEAVEILSRSVAADSSNDNAVDLLREALEGADAASRNKAVEAIQQASYANPKNLVLVELLAETLARSGKTDEAAKVIRASSESIAAIDKNQAAGLMVVLGDIYAEAEQTKNAIAAYNQALTLSGIENSPVTGEVENEFAGQVFGRMINAYKYANQYAEADAVIVRAKIVLSKDDSFAEKQKLALLLETGKRGEALQVVRAGRTRFPNDESLLRREAMLLAESGKVDDAVALIRERLKGKTSSAPSALQDDFGNLLFISSLYTQGKRGKEAVATANEAISFAKSDEREQLAKLRLATAQQESGDFPAAEKTLREIIVKTPGNPIALNNLGYFLIERNERIEEAVNLIKQALKIDPTNPSYLDSLGWAYFKLGKFAEAEKTTRDAARRSSESSTIYEHLGDIFQAQGKSELARAAWQKSLNLAADATDVSRIKTKLVPKQK